MARVVQEIPDRPKKYPQVLLLCQSCHVISSGSCAQQVYLVYALICTVALVNFWKNLV